MFRPYWTVLKDAFHEAFVSRVLWILLAVLTLILLSLIPLELCEQRVTQLQLGSVNDWPALISHIYRDANRAEPSPGKRIWDQSDEDFRHTIAEVAKSENAADISRQMVPRLLDALNKLIGSRQLYDAAAWKGITLDEQTTTLLDKGIDKLSEDDLAVFNRQLLQAAFPKELAGMPEKELRLTYFGTALGGPLPISGSMARPLIQQLVAQTMDFLVGTVAVFIAILVTAPMIPQTFEAGSIDLLLSKPVARPLLFLVKFLGGCVFILLNAGYFIVGLWAILGFRFQLWNNALLWCIPVFLFLFVVYYSVSAWAAVLWKNATVSIVLTILFWAACFTVETAKNLIERFFINPARITQLIPTDDSLLAVNQAGDFVEWHSTDWETILKPEQGGPFSRRNILIGPVYDASRKQIAYIQRTQGGRMRFLTSGTRLVTVAWSAGSWKRNEGPTPPSGASWLFNDPEGNTTIVAPSGVFRLNDKNGSGRAPTRLLGFAIPFTGGGGDSYIPIGPKPALRLEDSFAAAMHPLSGDLVLYQSGVIYRLRRQKNGTYRRDGERKLENAEQAALLAFAGEHIVLASSDGQTFILRADTLETQKQFRPAGKGEPYQIKATADGRQFAVLFHNGTLALFDAQGEQLQTLGGVSAIQFDDKGGLFVADRATRVTRYDLNQKPFQIADRYAPPLDTLQATYRYFILPFYTVFPKPGELGNVVNYLLTDQDTITEGSPIGADLRQTRTRLDVFGPIWSSLAFVVVMLSITCWYIHRADI